jgi:hypothetical protein
MMNTEFVTCDVRTWDKAACVPHVVAEGVTLPTSPVVSDGASLYYVASGSVYRVGL